MSYDRSDASDCYFSLALELLSRLENKYQRLVYRQLKERLVEQKFSLLVFIGTSGFFKTDYF